MFQGGCHLLVATPGRLDDFLRRNVLSFSAVKFVVLDEADRMLDQGFRGEIEKFLNHESMRKVGCWVTIGIITLYCVSSNFSSSFQQDHQTLLFSATFGTEVQKLAANHLSNYVFISVGIVGGACKDVEQNFVAVDKSKKKPMLKEVLEKEGEKLILLRTLNRHQIS